MEVLNFTQNIPFEIFSLQNMDSEYRILVLFLLLLFTYALFRRNKFKKMPPGPTGIPIFGYLPFLGKEPHKTICNLSKKYGPVVGFYLGQKYVVVLNDWISKKDASCNPGLLYKPENSFDAMPKGLGFSNSNGAEWSEQRRYSMRILKDLGIGKSIWEEMLQEEVNDTIKNLQGKEGKPVDVLDLFSSCFTNSMLALLFGYRLPPNHSTTKFLTESMDILMAEFYPLSFSFFCPILHSFFSKLGFCSSSRIKIQPKELNAYVENATKSVCLKQEKDGSIKMSFTKLYNIAVENNEKFNLHNSFTEDSLIANNQGLLIGGSDTSRLSFVWLLIAMAHYPEVQSRVHKELDNVIGREGTIKWSDRNTIPYTYACILESLRWRSLVTINGFRVPLEDTEILGYHIPKGTFVTSNHWAIHNDPKYWRNPKIFDPERFLLNEGKEVRSKMESFTPFSSGKRNCPGEHITLVNLLQYFVGFMQWCTVLPVEGDDINYEVELGLNYKPNNVQLCFIFRE